jgi:hypothetical protein
MTVKTACFQNKKVILVCAKIKIMKKLITISILLFLLTVSTYAQVTQIVPINSLQYPNGAYRKDLNGEFNRYVGTWEGVLNNKKYTFVFQKFEQHLYTYLNNTYEYADRLKVKFKITDLATNSIIYDGLNAINYEDFPIYAASKPYNTLLTFVFKDTEVNCFNTLEFTLKNVPNMPNQLKYCYFKYDDFWIDSCANYQDRMSIPVFLPKEVFILTKLQKNSGFHDCENRLFSKQKGNFGLCKNQNHEKINNNFYPFIFTNR